MDIAKLPVGIQTFSEIRTRGLIYVDKTDLVYSLANTSKFNFLSRPRRFGKSLLLSTLHAYFDGRKELFEGLKIQGLEKEWAKYPVIRLDMNSGEFQNLDGVEQLLDEQLSEYESYYGIEKDQYNSSSRFKRLIRTAALQTGKPVVILVDEYEKPILETINSPELQAHHRGLLKPFYATLKSCDEYIRFVMLTGVTKMGHLSVFSDLNNVVNQTLEPRFAAICGFTKEQITEYFSPFIEALAERYKISFDDTCMLLKKQYDGYRFSYDCLKVFNPYSLLNAFLKNKIGDFWFETGTPSFLVNVLRKKQFRINQLDGITVSPEDLTEVDDDFSNPIPLLYQSGYLTIEKYDEQYDDYTLGYPNQEVRRGFLNSLIPNYLSMTPSASKAEVRRLTNATISGDIVTLMASLESLISSIPPSPREVYEYLYRDSVYLIFELLGFNVHSEVQILSGRIDCVVKTDDYVYVIEFKVNETAQKALNQIYEKGYTTPYLNTHRTLYAIGVNFDTVDRHMTYVVG